MKIRNSEIKIYAVLALAFFFSGFQTFAQRQMENLDRGIVAVRTPGDSAFISWRLLGTEPEEIAFNLYRKSGNEKPVKLNKTPITESTNFQDGKPDFIKPAEALIRLRPEFPVFPFFRLINWMELYCGKSTSGRIFVRALITRNSWFMTSMAMALPNSPAKLLMEPSTEKEL